MEEESKAKPRDISFSKETFQLLGYVPSLDHAEKLISSFEAKNTVKFMFRYVFVRVHMLKC